MLPKNALIKVQNINMLKSTEGANRKRDNAANHRNSPINEDLQFIQSS